MTEDDKTGVLDFLRADFDRLDVRLERINTRLDELTSRIGRVERSVADLHVQLTPAEAQRVQDDAREHERWLIWSIKERDGRFTAYGAVPDAGGGSASPESWRPPPWTSCTRCCQPG